MPGVLVEASSPALIEKTRSVVTDSAGQYRIVDLSPGTYEVAFTLAGFKTVRRGNIVLEGSFTAPVNAELQVGAVEETLTVTAESPTVDVINNMAAFVANREVLDSIPTPIRNTPARALLIPGTTVMPNVLGQYNMTGARVGHRRPADGDRRHARQQPVRQRPVQRLLHERRARAGSDATPPAPNRRRCRAAACASTGAERRRQHVLGHLLRVRRRAAACSPTTARTRSSRSSRQSPGTAYDYQINPSFGGPLKKDKLWFYFTYKYQDNKIYVAELEVRRRQPGVPQLDGQLQRRRPGDVGGLEQGQDPRSTSRSSSTASSTTASTRCRRRRPKRRPMRSASAGCRRCSGRGRSRTSCCSKPGISYYNQPYEQNYRETVEPRDLAAARTTTNGL